MTWICLKTLPLVLALSVAGQTTNFQSTQTQTQPAPAPASPCNKTTPAPPHKPGWLETKAKALACKQNKNLCDLPSSTSDITGSTQTAKPCPSNTLSNSAPASKPPVPAGPAPANAAPPSSTKPTLACPPKGKLIPEYRYCLMPDGTTEDAIPIAPTPTKQVPTAAAGPTPVSADGKTNYLFCPPNTIPITNLPYCLLPDHSTVEATPLPSNMKPSPATAPNQPQQH